MNKHYNGGDKDCYFVLFCVFNKGGENHEYFTHITA